MQKTLHIHLKPTAADAAELRYYFDNPNNYKERVLELSAIQTLIDHAETFYYVARPLSDLFGAGKQLYHWLDGEDRFLSDPIESCRSADVLVLAISTDGKLAHLPWEVLHDGTSFLVQRNKPVIVPARWIPQKTEANQPANRPLQVLFMACSPTNVNPVLDFEHEEGLILNATKKQPMSLTVEESGELNELRNLIDTYGPGYFDVFHLSGHANITDEGPRFYTENEIGENYPAPAADIMNALPHTPQLIFLSGCRTGEAGKAGGVPSLAEELLKIGAKSVLGWGRSVLDDEASQAAAELYAALSASHEVPRAVGETWQALIKNKARDWHLLRLYIAGEIPGPLVTPLKTLGRKKAPLPSVVSKYFANGKVPTREAFIGRRRELQRCLRKLRENDPNIAGILIHGMGGLGKTSLTSRLCDRLSNDYTPVIWVGEVDKFKIVNKLCEDLKKPLQDILMNPDDELKYKLRDVFEKARETPFLLILDDFEANFEKDKQTGELIFRGDGLLVLSAEAKTVLEALVFAIRKSNSPDRLIITSRYKLNIAEAEYFYHVPLAAFPDADVKKKVSRLEREKKSPEKGSAGENLKPKAVIVADGNPRLLEWLYEILGQKGLNHETILERMAEKEAEFREKILAAELLKQQASELREMLAHSLIYDLPVPQEAIAAVCETIPDWEKHIERASALGLIEVMPLPNEETLYRAPKILEPLLKAEMPENREVLAGIAAETLYRIWWNEENATEERAIEIHRLALAGKAAEIAINMTVVLSNQWYNRSRFREVVILCEATMNVVGEDYRLLHSLAKAERNLGDVDKALRHYQQALQACPDENVKEKGAILHNTAIIYRNQGETEEALRLYRQSLEIKEKIGNVKGKAATLHQMAIIYRNQGETEEALRLYRQSLEIKEKIGNVKGKAATLHQMAIIYANQGETEEALRLFRQSADIEEKIGNVQGKAATLHQMAGIYEDQGETEEALRLYRQSLEIKEKIGDVQGKAITLGMIAQILASRGDFKTALDYFQESIAILERIKSPIAKQVKETMAKVQAMAK
jgi:tetratricopeptide (TPR) repeat protein